MPRLAFAVCGGPAGLHLPIFLLCGSFENARGRFAFRSRSHSDAVSPLCGDAGAVTAKEAYVVQRSGKLKSLRDRRRLRPERSVHQRTPAGFRKPRSWDLWKGAASPAVAPSFMTRANGPSDELCGKPVYESTPVRATRGRGGSRYRRRLLKFVLRRALLRDWRDRYRFRGPFRRSRQGYGPGLD